MRNGNINLQELKEYAKSLNGTTLETRTQHRKFQFYADNEGFHYKPLSTMKMRNQDDKYIDLVLERFNKKKSLRTSVYHDLTMNASYLLVVIEKYINA